MTTLLAACSTGGGSAAPFPPAVMERFVEACVTVGANQAYCSCLIDGIEETVSLEQFTQAEPGILYGGEIAPAVREQLGAITTDCIRAHG